MADAERCSPRRANPLPQALVLTAIVIGFAFVCFALVLLMALLAKRPEGDVDRLADAEPAPAPTASRCPSTRSAGMSAAMANLALAPVLVPLTGAVGCVLLAGRPRLAEGFSLLAGLPTCWWRCSCCRRWASTAGWR
jgi:hypothetical protein